MIQVPQVFRETGVHQDHLALDLRGLQERRVSRVYQEDQEVLEHPVLKVNQACQLLRKAYQDPEDRMENQDCPAHQVTQVSLDSLDSPVYQEPRVILDSLASDSQDPQVLKDSQVSPDSQDLLEDQADQELMDFPASLEYLDPRASLALVFLALQVYQEYLDLKDSLDQREILVSLAALVHLDDLDLTAVQELKAIRAYLVHLELVDHLDPPPLAQWDNLAHLVLLAQWDHQDSLDQMVQRETLVLQV